MRRLSSIDVQRTRCNPLGRRLGRHFWPISTQSLDFPFDTNRAWLLLLPCAAVLQVSASPQSEQSIVQHCCHCCLFTTTTKGHIHGESNAAKIKSKTIYYLPPARLQLVWKASRASAYCSRWKQAVPFLRWALGSLGLRLMAVSESVLESWCLPSFSMMCARLTYSSADAWPPDISIALEYNCRVANEKKQQTNTS